MKKKMLVNLVQRVNASKIRNETLNGVDYIVIPSKTMPDDVVLNGVLYPKDEIDKTIETIHNSPAPIDHPTINGSHVSAYDPQAALEFGAGINKYIGKEGDIHIIEKWVNKEILENTERGRRLADAITASQPIHSSTGVLLETQEQSGENEYGTYNKVASIHNFDHDAILPDSDGAGTPEKTGTGLFLNNSNKKEEIEVFTVNLSSGEDFSNSVNETRRKLHDAIRQLTNPNGDKDTWSYVEDFNSDTVIYESDCKLMAIQYVLTDGSVTLVGDPKETKAKTVFEFNSKEENIGIFKKLARLLNFDVKYNKPQKNEVDMYKEKIIQALNSAGVQTEGLDDDALFTEHNKLIAANAVKDKESAPTIEQIAALVSDGVAAGIKANEAEKEKSAKSDLVSSVIANSDYTDEDKELLLNTDARILKSMLPKKIANTLGAGVQINSVEVSDHEVDLNGMMKENS